MVVRGRGTAQRVAYQLPRARRRPPSKSERSRARSGRLHRRVRRPDLLSGCHQHGPTTPSWNHTGITGVRSGSRSCGITPAQRALIGNHAQHGITPCITGRDREPRSSGITRLWYHVPQNAPSAPRAFVPHRHNAPSAQRASVPRPAPRASA